MPTNEDNPCYGGSRTTDPQAQAKLVELSPFADLIPPALCLRPPVAPEQSQSAHVRIASKDGKAAAYLPTTEMVSFWKFLFQGCPSPEAL